MGPNASNEKAVNCFAKAMGVTKQLMDNFDLDCKVLKRAGHHVAKAATCDLKSCCRVGQKLYIHTSCRPKVQKIFESGTKFALKF